MTQERRLDEQLYRVSHFRNSAFGSKKRRRDRARATPLRRATALCFDKPSHTHVLVAALWMRVLNRVGCVHLQLGATFVVRNVLWRAACAPCTLLPDVRGCAGRLALTPHRLSSAMIEP